MEKNAINIKYYNTLQTVFKLLNVEIGKYCCGNKKCGGKKMENVTIIKLKIKEGILPERKLEDLQIVFEGYVNDIIRVSNKHGICPVLDMYEDQTKGFIRCLKYAGLIEEEHYNEIRLFINEIIGR